MKYGDKYHRGTGNFVKVMAFVDGYVMYRFPRCYPVILPEKSFLAEFTEAPQEAKVVKNSSHNTRAKVP